MLISRSVLAGFLLLMSGVAAHANEPRTFARAEQRQHYEQLISELRCLMCQNQNLADSDADLARDLRDEVYMMLTQQGKTDKEIVAFMVDRYGDFVLYRPPVRKTTVLLWYGPFVLGGAGVLTLLIFLSLRARRQAAVEQVVDTQDQARLQVLLGDTARIADKNPGSKK